MVKSGIPPADGLVVANVWLYLDAGTERNGRNAMATTGTPEKPTGGHRDVGRRGQRRRSGLSPGRQPVEGGLFLDQTIPLPKGSRIRLRFALPGDSNPLDVTVEIVNVDPTQDLGMGARFVELTRSTQLRIEAFVESELERQLAKA